MSATLCQAVGAVGVRTEGYRVQQPHTVPVFAEGECSWRREADSSDDNSVRTE